MALPLEGIHVVDAAQIYAGPGTAMLLADQGADVIKLEPPGGDGSRHMYTSPALGPFGKSFLVLNRNKRSIVADLTRPEGREVLHRLARWADVMISNLLPATAARLEADYESLSRINPRLVYAAVSTFGSRGPDAGKPGYDLLVQARAGILASRRMPDGTPVTPATMVADLSCSMLLSYAIMAALWERQRTGRGRLVEISLMGMALAIQSQQLVRIAGDDTPIPGSRPSALSSPYRCADGRWLMMVVITTRQWEGLCRVLDLEHLVEDPALATYDSRSRHTPELSEVLTAVIATRPLDEWLPLWEAAGVPCAPVVEREEVFDDPHLLANQMFVSTQHPVVGKVEMLGFPFTLSGQQQDERLRRPAPAIGEHSRETLAELGYTPEEIASLLASGAVQGPLGEGG